jgi:hypothetical protein
MLGRNAMPRSEATQLDACSIDDDGFVALDVALGRTLVANPQLAREMILMIRRLYGWQRVFPYQVLQEITNSLSE